MSRKGSDDNGYPEVPPSERVGIVLSPGERIMSPGRILAVYFIGVLAGVVYCEMRRASKQATAARAIDEFVDAVAAEILRRHGGREAVNAP